MTPPWSGIIFGGGNPTDLENSQDWNYPSSYDTHVYIVNELLVSFPSPRWLSCQLMQVRDEVDAHHARQLSIESGAPTHLNSLIGFFNNIIIIRFF